MKKIFNLFICLICIAVFTKAQVSVTATAGVATGTYTTLNAAFNAINNGTHKGDIKILITGTITQLVTAMLNASGNGSALYTHVAIRPSAPALITGNINSWLIYLNGAQNVMINGYISDTSTTRALTLQNTSTGASASTVVLTNASSDTLAHLIIRGSAQDLYGGTVVIENERCLVNDNEIAPTGHYLPSCGIKSHLGLAQITNNLVHDFNVGIYGGDSVIGNSIYFTQPGSLFRFIKSDTRTTILNNFIGGSAPFAGGGPAVLNGGL